MGWFYIYNIHIYEIYIYIKSLNFLYMEYVYSIYNYKYIFYVFLYIYRENIYRILVKGFPQSSYLPFLFFLFFFFLGWLLGHMEIPRLGIQSELQLPAYTTVTATWDLSCVCSLHCSLWQHRILNPVSEPGMEPSSSWILVRFVTHWATKGTPSVYLFLWEHLSSIFRSFKWGK